MRMKKIIMVFSVAMMVFTGMFLVSTVGAGPPPSGYTYTGNAGTDGADGVVTLSPYGSSAYMYISTNGGASGVGALPTGTLGSETNGTLLTSPVFSANAGDHLKFYFNYVTSDGAGYADYAWAAVENKGTSAWTYLVTARTEPTGSIIPGTGMPAVSGTLTPSSVPIIAGGPTWSELGSSSGSCFAGGCGYTGWVLSDYIIPTAGNYELDFGTVNWSDTGWDSGLAIDGATIAGKPISGVPEPATMLLLGLGLIGLAGVRRKFKQ